ncbi:SusC/RagA family TonB-linked outer membrane protein [Sphingobacterium chuzhouense]|uniref:TonB-dependent receptor n=1 Tax=Sphingobacterium chuzhouense TaxID=1742264 RepID=A0ABR7XVW6_9SPHI|nr:TonB-dependent receptor [Sphingobacterium chuzhouense]MBD1423190.1 TonB-dependent receptor [Sphingobacterium chuzhouense]
MKKKVAKWLGILSMLLISATLSAQTDHREISGKVTDEGGEPLSGVTVSLKNVNVAAMTNDAGEYAINVPDITSQPVLVFAYVGMKLQEVALGAGNVLNIVMESEAMGLEEVVAIGYGTARKKDLTGSVAIVNGEDLAKRNEMILSQALQGAAPGVSVTRSSGLPGATGTIRVRGITTIGDSNPLILVDGIPVESIDRVNPQDVESISVLKDAASASIYGSRASAGVILITTKQAKTNQINLEYQGLYGIIKPTQFPGTVDHIRYMEMINEVAWNDGGNQAGAEYNVYSKDFIEDYNANHRLTDPFLFPIMNWRDELVNDYAPNMQHGLSLMYGNNIVKTRASLNYEKADALYNHRSFDRISTRINNEFKITDFLSADINGSYLRSANVQPIMNPLSHAYKYGPLESPYWSDGRISFGRNGTNSWARLNHGGFNNTWGDELVGRFALSFKPIKNLNISGVIAPSIRSVKGKQFIRQVPFYEYDNTTAPSGYINGNLTTSLAETRSEVRTTTKQLTANYNTNFGENHDLSIMAGYEDYYRFSEGLNASSDNLALADYPYLDRANLDYLRNGGDAVENAYNSYFGRVMYDYANKYLLQANIRYDGSSRFHKDYRWASFPSVSAGWVVTEESFIKDLHLRGLDFFKLRGSWGNLGNERIGNYPYQAILNFNNALFVDKDGNIVSNMTAAQVGYNIRDISWETTEQWNIGFDATLLSNRLSLTADYYKKTTRDMLLALEIPAFMGFDNPDQNAGRMHTKGWEAQIGWRDQIGDFKYSISANISDYKSMMGDLSGMVFLDDQVIQEGVEYNSWYGYRSDGLFHSQEDIDNSALLSQVVRPGDVKYQDLSGSDGTPDGMISPEYDRVPLGGSLPRFYYGGNVNLSYKGFDAYLMFQGVGKQTSRLTADQVYQTAAWHTFPDFVDGNYYSEYNTPEQNSNVRYPRLSQLGYDGNNYRMSDFWLFDGSYFRLKNVTLGYTLPSNWSDVLKTSNVRVYASANDLFSLDKYPKGWDPESGITAYIARTWNFGVQVRF